MAEHILRMWEPLPETVADAHEEVERLDCEHRALVAQKERITWENNGLQQQIEAVTWRLAQAQTEPDPKQIYLANLIGPGAPSRGSGSGNAEGGKVQPNAPAKPPSAPPERPAKRSYPTALGAFGNLLASRGVNVQLTRWQEQLSETGKSLLAEPSIWLADKFMPQPWIDPGVHTGSLRVPRRQTGPPAALTPRILDEGITRQREPPSPMPPPMGLTPGPDIPQSEQTTQSLARSPVRLKLSSVRSGGTPLGSPRRRAAQEQSHQRVQCSPLQAGLSDNLPPVVEAGSDGDAHSSTSAGDAGVARGSRTGDSTKLDAVVQMGTPESRAHTANCGGVDIVAASIFGLGQASRHAHDLRAEPCPTLAESTATTSALVAKDIKLHSGTSLQGLLGSRHTLDSVGAAAAVIKVPQRPPRSSIYPPPARSSPPTVIEFGLANDVASSAGINMVTAPGDAAFQTEPSSAPLLLQASSEAGMMSSSTASSSSLSSSLLEPRSILPNPPITPAAGITSEIQITAAAASRYSIQRIGGARRSASAPRLPTTGSTSPNGSGAAPDASFGPAALADQVKSCFFESSSNSPLSPCDEDFGAAALFPSGVSSAAATAFRDAAIATATTLAPPASTEGLVAVSPGLASIVSGPKPTGLSELANLELPAKVAPSKSRGTAPTPPAKLPAAHLTSKVAAARIRAERAAVARRAFIGGRADRSIAVGDKAGGVGNPSIDRSSIDTLTEPKPAARLPRQCLNGSAMPAEESSTCGASAGSCGIVHQDALTAGVAQAPIPVSVESTIPVAQLAEEPLTGGPLSGTVDRQSAAPCQAVSSPKPLLQAERGKARRSDPTVLSPVITQVDENQAQTETGAAVVSTSPKSDHGGPQKDTECVSASCPDSDVLLVSQKSFTSSSKITSSPSKRNLSVERGAAATVSTAQPRSDFRLHKSANGTENENRKRESDEAISPNKQRPRRAPIRAVATANNTAQAGRQLHNSDNSPRKRCGTTNTCREVSDDGSSLLSEPTPPKTSSPKKGLTPPPALSCGMETAPAGAIQKLLSKDELKPRVSPLPPVISAVTCPPLYSRGHNRSRPASPITGAHNQKSDSSNVIASPGGTSSPAALRGQHSDSGGASTSATIACETAPPLTVGHQRVVRGVDPRASNQPSQGSTEPRPSMRSGTVRPGHGLGHSQVQLLPAASLPMPAIGEEEELVSRTTRYRILPFTHQPGPVSASRQAADSPVPELSRSPSGSGEVSSVEGSPSSPAFTNLAVPPSASGNSNGGGVVKKNQRPRGNISEPRLHALKELTGSTDSALIVRVRVKEDAPLQFNKDEDVDRFPEMAEQWLRTQKLKLVFREGLVAQMEYFRKNFEQLAHDKQLRRARLPNGKSVYLRFLELADLL